MQDVGLAFAKIATSGANLFQEAIALARIQGAFNMEENWFRPSNESGMVS